MKKLFVFVVIILMLVTGCTEKEVAEKEAAPEQSSENKPSEEAAEESDKKDPLMAPDFELESLDGTMMKLSELRDKNIIINFWGTWCGFCVEEMPDLQKLQDTYKDDLLILAVNVGDSKEIIEEFMEENKLKLTVLIDKDYKVSSMYGVSSYPSTLAVNKKGEIIGAHLGMLTYDQMDRLYNFFGE